MLKKLLFTALLSSLLIGLIGCGGLHPETSKEAVNNKIQKLVAPIYIKVSMDKDNNFNPVSLSSSYSRSDDFTLKIGKNGIPTLVGFRTGMHIMCKGRLRKELYCKYDTPFFSNTVFVRIKPGGGINLWENDLYDFLSKHDLYDKIDEYNEVNKVVVSKLHDLELFSLAQEKKYKQKTPNYSLAINDKSGLYDKSMNFKSIVSYEYNAFAKPTYNIAPYVLNNTSNFSSREKAKFLNALPSIKSKFKADIANKIRFVTMKYSRLSQEKYQYTIKKVEKLFFNKPLKIAVNINTANIKLNYPIMKTKDKVLATEEGIKITNNSNNFVSIKSLSYYFNKGILLDTDFDKNSILEIAPEAYIELSKDAASNKFSDALTYNETTASKLKKSKLSYGIAIKYVTSNSSKAITLYKRTNTTAYNIYKMK